MESAGITRTKIYLNASWVANVIGKNRYKSPAEIIPEVYQKNRGITDRRNPVEREVDSLSVETLKTLYSQITLVGLEPPTEIMKKVVIEEAKKEADEMIDNQDVQSKIPELADAITHTANVNRGIRHESSDLAVFGEQHQKVLRSNTPIKYLRITAGEFEFTIGCRYDAINEDGVIVETKRRSYRFLGIREYEQVQLEMYIRSDGLHDNQKCIFLENYNGEQKVQTYHKDDHFFEEITSGLGAFGHMYNEYASAHE